MFLKNSFDVHKTEPVESAYHFSQFISIGDPAKDYPERQRRQFKKFPPIIEGVALNGSKCYFVALQYGLLKFLTEANKHLSLYCLSYTCRPSNDFEITRSPSKQLLVLPLSDAGLGVIAKSYVYSNAVHFRHSLISQLREFDSIFPTSSVMCDLASKTNHLYCFYVPPQSNKAKNQEIVYFIQGISTSFQNCDSKNLEVDHALNLCLINQNFQLKLYDFLPFSFKIPNPHFSEEKLRRFCSWKGCTELSRRDSCICEFHVTCKKILDNKFLKNFMLSSKYLPKFYHCSWKLFGEQGRPVQKELEFVRGYSFSVQDCIEGRLKSVIRSIVLKYRQELLYSNIRELNYTESFGQRNSMNWHPPSWYVWRGNGELFSR
jgi:hypothetical protein